MPLVYRPHHTTDIYIYIYIYIYNYDYDLKLKAFSICKSLQWSMNENAEQHHNIYLVLNTSSTDDCQ